MRKEFVWAMGLALIFVGVIYTQKQLRDFAKDPSKDSTLFLGEEIPADSAGATDETLAEITEEVESSEAQEQSGPDRDLPVEEPLAASESPQGVPDLLQQSIQAARQSFRQKDAIAQAKPQDVHSMPKQTLDAAQQLATLAELEQQYPDQAALFRDFYLECSRDDKMITVIRAQCLNNYLKLANLDKSTETQLLSEFPPEIVRLYEALQ
jgi:hypothetical protein